MPISEGVYLLRSPQLPPIFTNLQVIIVKVTNSPSKLFETSHIDSKFNGAVRKKRKRRLD